MPSEEETSRDGTEEAVDAELWGPEPSEAELGEAVAAGRAALERARGELPAGWGLDASGKPLAGLEQARASYPGSDLSFGVWMTSPCADLNDMTPAQALEHGRLREVVAEAEVIGQIP